MNKKDPQLDELLRKEREHHEYLQANPDANRLAREQWERAQQRRIEVLEAHRLAEARQERVRGNGTTAGRAASYATDVRPQKRTRSQSQKIAGLVGFIIILGIVAAYIGPRPQGQTSSSENTGGVGSHGQSMTEYQKMIQQRADRLDEEERQRQIQKQIDLDTEIERAIRKYK